MRQRLWLWGPALVAVALRLALFASGELWAQSPTDLRGDAADYHIIGRSLAEGEGFTYDPDDPASAGHRPRYEVEPLRTPGYPVAVAAVYAVVGPRPGAVLFLQILLEAATCLLIALAFRETLGERGAGLAALTYAVHHAAAIYSVILLSEAVFVFCLVAAFQVGLARAEAGTLRSVGAGLLLGIATLVRPLAIWLPFVAGAVVLWRGRANGRRTLGRVGLMLGAAVVVVAPWLARNEAVWGQPILSTSSAYNALVLYATPVYARAEGLSDREAEDRLQAEADRRALTDGVVPQSDVDRVPYWRELAVETVVERPLTTAWLEVVGIGRQFVSVGRVSRLHLYGERDPRPREPGIGGALRWWGGEPLREQVLDLWALAFALVAYPLLALGVFRAVRERRGGVLLAAGALALFLIAATGIPGYSRFMVPAVPFWAGFVGLALTKKEPALPAPSYPPRPSP